MVIYSQQYTTANNGRTWSVCATSLSLFALCLVVGLIVPGSTSANDDRDQSALLEMLETQYCHEEACPDPEASGYADRDEFGVYTYHPLINHDPKKVLGICIDGAIDTATGFANQSARNSGCDAARVDSLYNLAGETCRADCIEQAPNNGLDCSYESLEPVVESNKNPASKDAWMALCMRYYRRHIVPITHGDIDPEGYCEHEYNQRAYVCFANVTVRAHHISHLPCDVPIGGQCEPPDPPNQIGFSGSVE